MKKGLFIGNLYHFCNYDNVVVLCREGDKWILRDYYDPDTTFGSYGLLYYTSSQLKREIRESNLLRIA